VQSTSQQFLDPHFEQEDTYWKNGLGTVDYDPLSSSATLLNINGVDKCFMYQVLYAPIPSPADLTFNISGDGEAHLRIGTTLHGDDVVADATYASGGHTVVVTTAAPTIFVEWYNNGGNNTSISVIDPHYISQATVDVEFTNTTYNSGRYIHYALNDDILVIVANNPDNSVHTSPDGAYPQEFKLSAGSWVINDIVFTNPPAAWSSVTSRPSSCALHLGTLWFVGQNTVWASKSGDHYNFDIGTALDNEAIVQDLTVEGTILWIKSLTELIIGTSKGEYIIKSGGGVITPTDIYVETISTFGSSPDQPIEAGDRVLFISKDRRKIRTSFYDEFKKGWNSPNIAFSGEHITKKKIEEISYCKEPLDFLYCLFQDGSHATCTYEQYLDIAAWAPHVNEQYEELTSVCTLHTDDGDDLFTLSKNGFSGSADTHVMNVTHLGDDFQHYLDSSLLSSIEPDGTVSGLGFLEGASVSLSIRTNGTYEAYPDSFIVDGSGQIQLPDRATGTVIVGLAYSQKLITLPMDLGSQGGSSSGMMKHVNKIFVRLYDSALPLINGTRAPDRSPETGMGYAEPDTESDDVEVTNMGRSKRAPITIEQDLPRRLEIQGLFGEVGQKGL